MGPVPVAIGILVLAGLLARSLWAQEAYTKKELVKKLLEFFPSRSPDPVEKLVLVTSDGRLFVFKGVEGTVSLPFSEIVKVLSDAGLGIGDVTNVIHNHIWPLDFSLGDLKLEKTLRELGFKGRFQLFYPEFLRLVG